MSLPSHISSVLGKSPLDSPKPDDWTHVAGLYFSTPAGLTVVPALCPVYATEFACELHPELTCEEGSKCVAVQLGGVTQTTDDFELDTTKSLGAINDMISKATEEYVSLQKEHFQSRLHTEVHGQPKSSEDETLGSRIRTYEQLLHKLNYRPFWGDWTPESAETDTSNSQEQAARPGAITIMESIATWLDHKAAFRTLRDVFDDFSSASETAKWNTEHLVRYRGDVARYEIKCASDPAKIAEAKSNALETFNSCFNASETLQSDALEPRTAKSGPIPDVV